MNKQIDADFMKYAQYCVNLNPVGMLSAGWERKAKELLPTPTYAV